ncbi:MAG: hypothetical protein J7501_03905 [Bdellovibrio sp.]|nr:hypothetical protein [Bdellovibrio sp.]
MSFHQKVQECERALILEALKIAGGSRYKAAKHLGIGRTTLIEKIKKMGIEYPYANDRDARAAQTQKAKQR